MRRPAQLTIRLAATIGAGLQAQLSGETWLDIRDSRFEQHALHGAAVSGSALAIDAGNFALITLQRLRIIGNTVPAAAGGTRSQAQITLGDSAQLAMIDSIVANSNGKGLDVAASTAGAARLQNLTISGHDGIGVALLGAGGPRSLVNSIVHGNYGASFGVLTEPGAQRLNNLGDDINAQDPLFVGPGDFHLQAGSPAIDAGTIEFGVGLFDVDGQPRVVGAMVDIGAHEAQADTLFAHGFEGTP